MITFEAQIINPSYLQDLRLDFQNSDASVTVTTDTTFDVSVATGSNKNNHKLCLICRRQAKSLALTDPDACFRGPGSTCLCPGCPGLPLGFPQTKIKKNNRMAGGDLTPNIFYSLSDDDDDTSDDVPLLLEGRPDQLNFQNTQVYFCSRT